MLSHQVLGLEVEEEWESLKYEHIDWNDIIEAELSGNSDALTFLRRKSEEMKKVNSLDLENPSSGCQQTSLIPLSYAQVVSPSQHGVKRTTSEREALSPIECCPKRMVRSHMVKIERAPLESTPLHCSSDSPEEETPDHSMLYNKANCGGVQRRLFASPKINQQTPTSPAQGNSPSQELTSHRLNQRQKQIDFGKNTLGYQRYIQTVPRWERKPTDPVTPDKLKLSSTRGWQGQIRLWRRALHLYDPPADDTFTSAEASLCEM